LAIPFINQTHLYKRSRDMYAKAAIKATWYIINRIDDQKAFCEKGVSLAYQWVTLVGSGSGYLCA
jgi:hypothetical protein